MKTMYTKYGSLKGVLSAEFYNEGVLKECILGEGNEIVTKYGKLMPQYDQDHVRHKYAASLSFYENGNIKSILLNQQTDIQTSLGIFAVEKITFYEDESLKRIFPVNGKLTGYWTEDNEYALAKEYTLQLGFGVVKSKIMSLQFYPSQKLKSLSLWPKERVMIQAGNKQLNIRIGISLYESGALKSCEPAEPTLVFTPIGTVIAYDTRAIGVHGENNSLQFYENGTLKAVASATDQVEIYDENNNKTTYTPQETPSMLHYNKRDLMPLYIAFYNDKVSINEELEYALDKYTFVISNNLKRIQPICGDCAQCSLCD